MSNKDIKIEHNKNSKSKTIEIIVENEATIKNEEDFYIVFLSILDKNDLIKITLKNIEAFDLAFLQLLISIEKTVLLLNKQVYYKFELRRSVSIIIENSGFDLKALFISKEITLID